MFGKLLPQEHTFFDFFDQHAALTARGVKTLHRLGEPQADVAALARQIKDIEHDCDKVTHACVAALHRTFITPIERNDIYRLISAMDDIMDHVEAASERLVLYDLKEVHPRMLQMTDVLGRCMSAVASAVGGLRSMKKPQPILDTCVIINQLENEADGILRAALAELFRHEKDILCLIKWKEIFETLENASDSCEDVAQIVEGVVLEHG